MVAKIFLSTSFLITRLALTPSFSESSLTVMPSEIGDLAVDRRRLASLARGARGPEQLPLLARLAVEPGRACPAGGRRVSVGGAVPGGDAAARCGCIGRASRIARPGPAGRRARRRAHTAGRDGAGPCRSAGREPARWPAGAPGTAGAAAAGRARPDCGLRESGDQIRPRRHNGPGGGLAGQVRTAARRNRRHGRSGGAGSRRRGCCRGRRGSGPAASGRHLGGGCGAADPGRPRQRLPRSGNDLAGTGQRAAAAWQATRTAGRGRRAAGAPGPARGRRGGRRRGGASSGTAPAAEAASGGGGRTGCAARAGGHLLLPWSDRAVQRAARRRAPLRLSRRFRPGRLDCHRRPQPRLRAPRGFRRGLGRGVLDKNAEMLPYPVHKVVVERAGVGHLFGHAKWERPR